MITLCDSGADLSVISYPVFMKLPKELYHITDEDTEISCVGASGNKLNIKTSANIKIKLGNSNYWHMFRVVDGLSKDMIIGSDFMKIHHASISYAKSTLYLNGNVVPFIQRSPRTSAYTSIPVISMQSALKQNEENPTNVSHEYQVSESTEKEPNWSEFYSERKEIYREIYREGATSDQDPPNPENNPFSAEICKIDNFPDTDWLNFCKPAALKEYEEVLQRGLGIMKQLQEIHTIDSTPVPEIGGAVPHIGLTDPNHKKKLISFLQSKSALFAATDLELTATNMFEFEIDTGDNPPVRTRPFRLAAVHQEFVDSQVKSLLDAGLIEPSSSPYSSPVIVVDKPRRGQDKDLPPQYRMCIDYRLLNRNTRPYSGPLPIIQDVLESLGGARYYSSLDLRSGYHQMPIKKEHRHKTAFSTRNGHFQYKVLPFGVTNGPACFQNLMTAVLGDAMYKHVICFLDDVLVFSPNFESHLIHLNDVMDRIDRANLKLKCSKCSFADPKVEFLGHIVSADGLRCSPDKISVLKEMERPTTAKEIRQFIGFTGFYRRFCENFSEICKPLTALTKKNTKWCWSDECERSFQLLKQKLISAPVLAYPDFTRPMILYVDASSTALGAILAQEDENGDERVILYLSHQLNDCEQRYSASERETLALVWALQKLKHYLLGTEFIVYTDHQPIRTLLSAKIKSPKIHRWAAVIDQFPRMQIKYKKGSEQKADFLSRLPPNPAKPGTDSGPVDEEDNLMQINVLNFISADRRMGLRNGFWDQETAVNIGKIDTYEADDEYSQLEDFLDEMLSYEDPTNPSTLKKLNLSSCGLSPHELQSIMDENDNASTVSWGDSEPETLPRDEDIEVIDLTETDEPSDGELQSEVPPEFTSEIDVFWNQQDYHGSEGSRSQTDNSHNEELDSDSDWLDHYLNIDSDNDRLESLLDVKTPSKPSKLPELFIHNIELPPDDWSCYLNPPISILFEPISDALDIIDFAPLEQFGDVDWTAYLDPPLSQFFEGHVPFKPREKYVGDWIENLEPSLTKLFTDKGPTNEIIPTVIEELETKQDDGKQRPIQAPEYTESSMEKNYYLNVVDTSQKGWRKADQNIQESPLTVERIVEELKDIGDNIGTYQLADPELKDIKTALKSKNPPEDFVLIDDIIYHVSKPILRDNEPRMQLVIPKQMRAFILESYHAPFHVSIEKTYNILRQRFYWKGMWKDCIMKVSRCEKCQRSNLKQARAPMTVKNPPTGPGALVSIDVTGPFPTSETGLRYCVVIMDVFTGFPEAYCTKNKEAETIAQILLNEYFPRYGFCQSLLSDGGGEFVADIIYFLSRKLGVFRIVTTPFSPWVNGCVENFNKYLKRALMKRVGQYHADWPEYVPPALMAYRCSVHDTHRFSPFFLQYGRDPLLQMDTLLRPKQRYIGEDYTTTQLLRLHDAFDLVKQHSYAARLRNKALYDKKSKPIDLKPGDPVWYFHPGRVEDSSTKLRQKWQPYYRIQELVTPVTATILHGPSGVSKRVHVNHLRKAYIEGAWDKHFSSPEYINDVPANENWNRTRPPKRLEKRKQGTRTQPIRACRTRRPADYLAMADYAGIKRKATHSLSEAEGNRKKRPAQKKAPRERRSSSSSSNDSDDDDVLHKRMKQIIRKRLFPHDSSDEPDENQDKKPRKEDSDTEVYYAERTPKRERDSSSSDEKKPSKKFKPESDSDMGSADNHHTEKRPRDSSPSSTEEKQPLKKLKP